MMGVQLVHKFPTPYRAQVFATVLTRTCYTTLPAPDKSSTHPFFRLL